MEPERARVFAANVTMLFPEVVPSERPAAAAAAGFTTVESRWPFEGANPSRAQIDSFEASIRNAGVELIQLNLYGGDAALGDRGLLSVQDRADELRASARVAVEIGHRTGCRRFTALYGLRTQAQQPEEQDRLAVRNLELLVEILSPINGLVLLEPLTRGENGAYPLCTAQDVVNVIERAGVPNVKLLADLYHLANNGDDLIAVLTQHRESVGHIQLADTPGRHEPGTGELNWLAVFDAIDAINYSTPLALEYLPTTDVGRTLAHLLGR